MTTRRFMDENFLEWEAYVSGGKPGGPAGARVYFVCLSAPLERPKFARHPSRSPAVAQRELIRISEAELRELFEKAQPVP